MRVYLLAHGSADPRHATDVALIAGRLAGATGRRVIDCYLDLCGPSLPEVADAPGVVVPLLFSPGYHVQVDVGDAVAAAGEALQVADPPLLTGAAAWAGDLLDETLAAFPGRPVVCVTAGTRDQGVLALWEQTAQHFGVDIAHASGPGAGLASLAVHDAVVLPLLAARGYFSDRIEAEAAGLGLPVAPIAGTSQALITTLAARIAA